MKPMQRLVIAVIGLFGAGLAHAEIVQVGVGNQEVVKTEQRIDRVALGDP